LNKFFVFTHFNTLFFYFYFDCQIRASEFTHLAANTILRAGCNDFVAVIQFQNGALGIVEATTAVRPKDLEGSLSLLGEKGTVVIGGFAVNQIVTWNFESTRPEDENMFSEGSQDPPNIYGFGHIPYLEKVVDNIQNGTPALVDGLEGRRSLELISAIYESIETGNEISLRFRPQKCRLGIRNG